MGTDRQFERLAALVGRPEWSQSDAVRTNAARVGHRDDLEAQLSAIFLGDTRANWVARCRAAGLRPARARPARGAALRDGTRARSVVESGGLGFVASPVRVDGGDRRLEFPPALDADGERIRGEFVPGERSAAEISPPGRPRRPEVLPSACATRSPRARWRPRDRIRAGPLAEEEEHPDRIRDRLQHSDERGLRRRDVLEPLDEERVGAGDLDHAEKAQHAN